MSIPGLQRILTTASILFILSIPQTAASLDLIVEHNPTDPSHFATIQAALDYASIQQTGSPPSNTSYRVVVKADSYPYYGAFSPISNVPIIGSETARTYLASNSNANFITLNNVSNVTIKNFTIISTVSAGTGIAVTNSSLVTIANNIFRVGSAGTALQIQGAPATTVVNNTFYHNGNALSTNSDCLITNNIFSGNGIAILAATNLTRLTYNTFHNNEHNGAITLDMHSLPNSSVTNPDPLFVDLYNYDFHLRSGSPCHIYNGSNAGNPEFPNADNPDFFDMGAYGGPDSDTIPKRISHLTASSTAPSNEIVLNWDLNLGYMVSGYHLYYGSAPGDRSGSGAAEGNSPVTVPQGVNSATLSNLTITTPATPAAITDFTVTPQPGGFYASWAPSVNATGYKVYYSTTPFTGSSPPTTFQRLDGPLVMQTNISTLTSGVSYYVAVVAIAQPSNFFTITAFTAEGGIPGVTNESSFAKEIVGYFGPVQESVPSDVATVVPTIIPPIQIGNTAPPGCFIATAAYGHYSAPQVQVLRDFRDRFLLTNAPGRAFVAWYYRYGPKGAEFINIHPWSKPFVRLLLLPLIGGSLFILHALLMVKCVVLAGILLLSGIIVRRKQTEKGGKHANSD